MIEEKCAFSSNNIVIWEKQHRRVEAPVEHTASVQMQMHLNQQAYISSKWVIQTMTEIHFTRQVEFLFVNPPVCVVSLFIIVRRISTRIRNLYIDWFWGKFVPAFHIVERLLFLVEPWIGNKHRAFAIHQPTECSLPRGASLDWPPGAPNRTCTLSRFAYSTRTHVPLLVSLPMDVLNRTTRHLLASLSPFTIDWLHYDSTQSPTPTTTTTASTLNLKHNIIIPSGDPPHFFCPSNEWNGLNLTISNSICVWAHTLFYPLQELQSENQQPPVSIHHQQVAVSRPF